MTPEERKALLASIDEDAEGLLMRASSAVGRVLGLAFAATILVGSFGGGLVFLGCFVLLLLKAVGVTMTASFGVLAVTGAFGLAVSWACKMAARGFTGDDT